jgi:ribosomal protein S18 acetylase RimI-like enzyme
MNVVAASETFTICDASLFDLIAIWRVERACFPKDAYGLFTLFNMAITPGLVRLKAVVDGQIVGFVAGEINRRDACGWIITVGVHPDYNGRGIGTALLLSAEQRLGMPVVKLTVRRGNTRAISLYERCGYRWMNTFRRYYHDGEDGLVMEKVM